eukprot:SAG31_NODE_310_length_17887_cov_4.623060_4_plen_76_part_00
MDQLQVFKCVDDQVVRHWLKVFFGGTHTGQQPQHATSRCVQVAAAPQKPGNIRFRVARFDACMSAEQSKALPKLH